MVGDALGVGVRAGAGAGAGAGVGAINYDRLAHTFEK